MKNCVQLHAYASTNHPLMLGVGDAPGAPQGPADVSEQRRRGAGDRTRRLVHGEYYRG
jgi:hypothetical protein